MAFPDRRDLAYQIELYALMNDALDRLPLETILNELTEIAIHLQHNTVDYCYGCESCPLRELCSRAAPSKIPVVQPALAADS